MEGRWTSDKKLQKITNKKPIFSTHYDYYNSSLYYKHILQVYIIKVAKLSPSSQVASKIKRTPGKWQNWFLSLDDY